MPVGAIAGVSAYGAYNQKRAGDKAAAAQGDAANAAANAQLQSSREANALQRYMYEQGRQDYSPYRTAGYGALNQLSSLYGINTGPMGQDLNYEDYGVESNELQAERDRLSRALWQTPGKNKLREMGFHYGGDDFDFSGITDDQIANFGDQNRNRLQKLRAMDADIAAQAAQRTTVQEAPVTPTGQQQQSGDPFAPFYNSPDYQFALQEGNKALDRSASARGQLFSGGQLKALGQYNQGLATQNFNNYANRLASIAGIGQTATGGTAALGAGAANAMSGNLMSAGQGAGRAALAAGDARASGYANQANAMGGLANNALSLYGAYKGGMFGGGGSGISSGANSFFNNTASGWSL